MALDPYAPCPAGTGKKLKFCCSDLVGELATIQQMLDGEQRLACLEHIDKLEARFPGRACLLTTKAMLLSALGRKDEAKRAVESVLGQSPMNPVALAESALLTLGEGDMLGAVETLGRAFAAAASPMPWIVINVVSTVAEMLFLSGRAAAAQGHLLLLLRYVPKDERALAMLVQLNAAANVPLLLKEDPDLLPAPDGVPWRGAFQEAIEPAHRGAWRLAADKLAALAQTAPDARAIWRNLARLRMWLADDSGAVEALRRLAALDLPADERVEVEALAQVLDPGVVEERVDRLSIAYPVTNAEELAEKLVDRRVVPAPVDPADFADEGQPPPRNAFMLLDRPAPRTGVGLARDAVPNVLAQLYLFGRQTDREARLEVELDRPNLPAAQAALAELCGPLLGSPEPEVIHGAMSKPQRALSWAWRLPEDTPVDEVHRLLVEQRRYAILNEWAQAPLAALDGRTPRDAAGDERLRIRLLAAVLAIELAFQEPSAAAVFDELRQQLGLPQPSAIDPTTIGGVDHVPLARLHRLDFSKLDDDALVSVFRRAAFTRAHVALRRCALAMVSREGLKTKLSAAQVYGTLADIEDDTSQAVKYLDQARQAAEAAGESTANWDLQELALRLDRGEPDQFGRLLAHIQAEHIREPGVARALTQLLVEAGLIMPDGRPAVPMETAAAAQGAAPEPGKIWTPESETPGKKSALWIPGTD